MSGWRAVWWGVGVTVAASGCSAPDEVELIYPSSSNTAQAVVAVDFIHRLTPPDNFVLRPEEFGSATADPIRNLIYVGTRDGTLFALDAHHGEIRWDVALEGAVSAPPVIVAVDEQPMLVVGTDNGVLHAIDLDDQTSRWRYETPGRIRTPSIVHEGVVFFTNSRDQVYALDLRTGDWRWQYEQELQTDFTVHGHAGLTLVPSRGEGTELGTLYACFDNGKVVALAAGSGQSLWIASVAPPEGGDFIDCDSTPLVDERDGAVYVSGQSTGVFAFDQQSGEPRWQFPLRAARSLALAPDGALVGSSSLEGVFMLERDGSALRWRSRTDPGVLSSPVLIDDLAIVTHSELGLLVFALETGEWVAQLRTGSGISGVPRYEPQWQRLFTLSNRGLFVSLQVGRTSSYDHQPLAP